MNKKTLLGFIILGAAIIGVVFWGITSGKKTAAPVTEVTGTVYFFGAECPHCKVINEFLEKNTIAEKVSFVKKEVWHDKANAKEMMQAAKQCGIDTKEVGVPFVFDNGTCFVGEPDVKKFFSEKAGL